MAQLRKNESMFLKLAEQLRYLEKIEYVNYSSTEDELIYLCPICLRKFSINDLDNSSYNMLTREHAPPESLGGKNKALTCSECNSGAGSKYDSHFSKRLNEIDGANRVPGSSARGRIIFRGMGGQARAHFKYSETVRFPV